MAIPKFEYLSRLHRPRDVTLPKPIHALLDTVEFKLGYVKAHSAIKPVLRFVRNLVSDNPWDLLNQFGIYNRTVIQHSPIPEPTQTYQDVVDVLTEVPFDGGRAVLRTVRPTLKQIPVPVLKEVRARPPMAAHPFITDRGERLDLSAKVEPLGEEDFELGLRGSAEAAVPEELVDIWATAPKLAIHEGQVMLEADRPAPEPQQSMAKCFARFATAREEG